MSVWKLPLAVCQEALSASMHRAEALGLAVSIAVVDDGGNLVAFARMDDAEIAGQTLAVDKAYTAVANRIATHELAIEAAPGGPLFGLHANAHGRYVIFGGGIPIRHDGEVVGAVGVSGAPVHEDVACATAGQAAAEEELARG